MSRRRAWLDGQGIFYLLALYVTSLVGLSVVVGLTQAMASIRAANHTVAQARAFQLAEGGVDDALGWLKAQNPPPAAANLRLYPFCNPITVQCAPPAGGGDIAATLTLDASNPNALSLFTYAITVGASAGGFTFQRTVDTYFRTRSFSRYMYFTNRERRQDGTIIWFVSSDQITGPLHSNDELNVSGSPTFDGPVSSTAASVHCMNHCPPDAPHFNGGLSLGVEPIPLSEAALHDSLEGLRTQADLVLTGNTTVTLDGGTMLVSNTAQAWFEHPVSLAGPSALYVTGGNLTLGGGTLNGQLTLGSDQDIIIKNSVNYTCDPEHANPADPNHDLDCRSASDNDDVLGLVATQNIKVAATAPTDVTIQASMMAINGSFSVENYNRIATKGTLHIFGGVIQNTRGAVGTFDSRTGRRVSGYQKAYRYDERFKSLAPPLYPRTNKYDLVVWREQ